jgi:hypothetical protein
MSDKDLETAVDKLTKDHKSIIDALTEGA